MRLTALGGRNAQSLVSFLQAPGTSPGEGLRRHCWQGRRLSPHATCKNCQPVAHRLPQRPGGGGRSSPLPDPAPVARDRIDVRRQTMRIQNWTAAGAVLLVLSAGTALAATAAPDAVEEHSTIALSFREGHGTDVDIMGVSPRS